MSVETWNYIIGDVHGCHDELVALEAKIARHATRHGVTPHHVSLGDLVDRGPESAQVVAHMREGVEAGTHSVIMGNHEAIMLTVLWDLAPWPAVVAPSPAPELSTVARDGEGERGFARALSLEDYRQFRRYMWQGQGGYDTLRSYGCDPDDTSSWTLPADDLRFLVGLPYHWEADGVVATHALATRAQLELLRAGRPGADADQDARDAFRKASDRSMWSRALPSNAPDPERVHVSGHTPLERVKHVQSRKIIQVDTGAVYGRRLTAWCADDGSILSVQAREHVF